VQRRSGGGLGSTHAAWIEPWPILRTPIQTTTPRRPVPKDASLDELREGGGRMYRLARCFATPRRPWFGEGAANGAGDHVLSASKPGDSEDLAGHPFVGPAGKTARQLHEGRRGVDRSRAYVTNAGQAFQMGGRAARGGSTSKPNSMEIGRLLFRGWRAEDRGRQAEDRRRARARPRRRRCSARRFRVTRDRGRPVPIKWAPLRDGGRCTHLSLLRAPDEENAAP